MQQGIYKQALWCVEDIVRVLMSDCYNNRVREILAQKEHDIPVHNKSPRELRQFLRRLQSAPNFDDVGEGHAYSEVEANRFKDQAFDA